MTIVTGPTAGPSHAPARPTMTPGRWVTLAIGVPIALVLILGGALSLVSDIGVASFRVDRAIPLDHGRLVASANGSDLTVRQGQASGAAARLTGTVQYSLVRPDLIVTDGTGFSLHCRLFLGYCGLNAVLSVPPGTALDLASGGGNMQVGGIQSAVTLTSGGGNLSVSDLGGVLKFVTGGGDVDGNGLRSPVVTVKSGGGNVTLTFTSVPSNVDVEGSGGNVTIVLPRSATQYALTVVTGGGDYQPSPSVRVNQAAVDRITVNSGGGNVSIAEAAG